MSKRLVRSPLFLVATAFAVVLGLLVTYAYMGAFIDPEGHAQSVPVAVASEDAGASFGTVPVDAGRALTQAVTAGTIADEAVRFTVVASRVAAIARMERDEAFAAVVVPRDFSARLVRVAATGAGPKAELEIVTNPAAGTIASSFARDAATRTAESFGRTVVAQISAGLRQAGAKPPAALADAVAVRTTVGVSIGRKSAEGTGPFFFELTVALGGFFLAAIVAFGVELSSGRPRLGLSGRLVESDAAELSHLHVTMWKAALTLVLCAVTGALQTVFALEALGMDATNPVKLGLFSALGSATIGMIALFLLLSLGVAGRIVAVLFTVLFGVPSSGGVYPRQVLPGFFRFLGDWLPLRRMTDGARSLTFFDGRLSAGLGTGIWVLLGYLVAFTALTLVWGRWVHRRTLLPDLLPE